MIGENTILSVAEGNFLLSRAKAKQRLKREGYPSSDQIIQLKRRLIGPMNDGTK